MKIIILNEDSLKVTEIDKMVKKVRGIVVNENTNKILLVRYAGVYMFPGGKIDSCETEIDALKREILEEAGIEINDDHITPYLIINSYNRNYPDRKDGIINRLTQTIFFKVVTNQNINNSKKCLTESEIENNHSIQFLDALDIHDLILANTSNNPRKEQFEQEIMLALDEYFKMETRSCVSKTYTKKI